MSASASWMPANGRHPVNIGSSLGRALKASKGVNASTSSGKRSQLPVRDFYSFRYNFKPPSIDPTKPGCIDVKQKKDTTHVTVEHPSSQSSDVHIFNGSETLAKEVDCVLVYDEDTNTYTLEKLDSYISLSHERKGTPSLLRTNASPTPPLATTNNKTDDFVEALESALAPDKKTMHLPAEEEESEDEKPLAVTVPTAKPLKASNSSPKKLEKAAVNGSAPKPSKAERSSMKGKQKGSIKPELTKPSAPPPPPSAVATLPAASLDVEEEVLHFGQPAQKRPRLSPPQATPEPSSSALALPGPSTTFSNPSSYGFAPPIAHHSSETAAPNNGSDSEDEEDWDEVAAVPSGEEQQQPANFHPESGDGVEELDPDIFMNEMNQMSMGITQHPDDSEEDFLAGEFAALASAPESPAASYPPLSAGRRPMSLGEFAMHAEVTQEQEDDDYSSSDDSDDD